MAFRGEIFDSSKIPPANAPPPKPGPRRAGGGAGVDGHPWPPEQQACAPVGVASIRRTVDEYPFLQRLLAEAPVEAFEEPLRDARERGLDGDRLEALREATVLAMQLRSVLQERRHRELELAALYETAGDLISIRHVERVLKAIARRARQLLDADTAYLTLIDEESGDTYMRVTDGMVTPEFGRLRLPLGVGLGGLVAQTAMPYFTSDYLHDRRFRHTAAIDDAVGGEQLNAILGVPLKLGDRVLGVLFAANRQARPFSPKEVNFP